VEVDHGMRGIWRDDHFEEDPGRKAKDGEELWSKRIFMTGSDNRSLTIEVGHEFNIVINMSGSSWPAGGAISIDLLRPGRDSERVWNFKARHANVSRVEYRQVFQ
ncbi:MAG TPA: hypothetical protein VMB03_03195, partial [Bryobacteraceae bacterium]|nr:hypothetical protein [Bryobacteraceae bacterium]